MLRLEENALELGERGRVAEDLLLVGVDLLDVRLVLGQLGVERIKLLLVRLTVRARRVVDNLDVRLGKLEGRLLSRPYIQTILRPHLVLEVAQLALHLLAPPDLIDKGALERVDLGVQVAELDEPKVAELLDRRPRGFGLDEQLHERHLLRAEERALELRRHLFLVF